MLVAGFGGRALVPAAWSRCRRLMVLGSRMAGFGVMIVMARKVAFRRARHMKVSAILRVSVVDRTAVCGSIVVPAHDFHRASTAVVADARAEEAGGSAQGDG
jgi:hypothetical protein